MIWLQKQHRLFCALVGFTVHREGGSESGPGGLGEEHLQWDGGGTGPGSR